MRIHGPNRCLIVFQRNLNGLNGMYKEAAQFAQNRMMHSSSSSLVTSDLWYSQPKPWQDNKCSSIIPHPRLSDESLCDICNLFVTKEPCQRSPGICPGIARNKWIQSRNPSFFCPWCIVKLREWEANPCKISKCEIDWSCGIMVQK